MADLFKGQKVMDKLYFITQFTVVNIDGQLIKHILVDVSKVDIHV